MSDNFDAYTEAAYQSYLAYLIAGDRNKCREVVEDTLRDNVDIKDLYVGVFQRALYRVGELWECNQLSVAREHIATAITESMLSLVYPSIFAAEHCGRKAIVACAANEYHQLGGKMVADILELNGWDGLFSGANTPAKDLLELINNTNPNLLCLSLSVQSGLPTLLLLLDNVRTEFPDLPIIVGGQAFRWGGRENIASYPDVRLVETIHELERLIKDW